MSRLDDLLRRELPRLAPRPAAEDPFGSVRRRARRRRLLRRAETLALAAAVLAGTIAGTHALARIFSAGRDEPAATPGPGNGLIVFSARSERGVHLFAVPPEGGEPRQLTPEGAATYIGAAASPDGRTVLAVHTIPSMEEGLAVLATVPIGGGSPTWLIDLIVVRDPAWSPDGTRIAFAGSPGGPYGIYVLDLATGGFRLVPGTDQIDVAHPHGRGTGPASRSRPSSARARSRGLGTCTSPRLPPRGSRIS